MTTSRVLTLSVGSMLVGLVVGYSLWFHQTARLRSELAQARAWLTEEMALSEARAEEIRHANVICAQADFARKEAEAALMDAEGKIQATTAMLDKVGTDWKSERQRRRDLERHIAATYHELPLAESKAGPK